ncbi:hypothetical protein ACRB9V_24045, partial [Salmonella enterica subsp. enterica serovar Paratyphi A]
EVREEDHSRRDCTHKLFRIESVVLFTISVDNTHISPEVVSGLVAFYYSYPREIISQLSGTEGSGNDMFNRDYNDSGQR